MADNTSQKAIKSAEKNKYPNAINRTTSESLRLGDSDKILSHPTTLSSTSANAKKKTSFQITSVTVGSRISNDGGDDSADDLDESHTDDISDVVDISRVTDIENETPSYSEDTFSKDDVFFNTSASLGTAPVIPTSSQYGLAIVANENCVNPSATCANNISGNELHVSVTDNVINLVGVKHNENEMRDIHSHSGRNERFKVVKIESTEPFRRGRWMCMDYLDHSMVQQQQSQSNVSNTSNKETNDIQNLNAQHTGTDSGISVTEMPPPVSTADDQVPSNMEKGTQEHQQYAINPNAGQTAPGGYPSVSPGQTMHSQPQSQIMQQISQSVSLNSPVQQNMINTSQHQSLQAQQMQQVMANAGMPVQQQPVQQVQQPPQQMQTQPIQMQAHMQQQQQQQQQPTPQQVPVSQPMPPQQQVQMQPPQPMPQMPPQQHIPQQPMHTIPISNQQMQVPQPMMQQIPQQPIPTQMQQQPQSYPQQTTAQQPLQQHIQQAMHQMAQPLQPSMTQNQPSPQTYQPTTMQQCPPGLPPQQMMSVPQHQLQPQPQYYTAQGIPMMTPPGQQQGQMMGAPGQQGQMMAPQNQQGQMMAPQGQQGQMMTSQGQMMTMPQQVSHQSTVPMQQTYSVTNIPTQQQSQPQQQQQPQPPPQPQQQQQQQQQQMSIGHSASMHHVPAASISTSVAGYVPVVTGQTPVSQPNPTPTVVAAGSSQTTPTVIQQQCYMMQQGAGQQTVYTSNSVPSSVVEAIAADPGMIEQVVQSAALLESLAEVTSAADEAPPTGEETESASGTSAVAIDNKIEQAMDLVKSHLMFAVREEVEVLKEKIAELMDRINHLEVENSILKANASQETLAQLTNLPPQPSSNNAP